MQQAASGPREKLIIIKYLKGINNDGLNHSDLPTSICDIATGIGAHEGRTGHFIH